jgi:hypothetical protein
MLVKKPKDHRINQIQLIALQESDFNQVNMLLIGRPVQHQLEAKGIIPDIQHGSRASKQCHSAIELQTLVY